MSLTRFGLPSVARLQQLTKLRSQVFETTYNPESLRIGSKVLKARLRGPAMLRYYGERISGWAGLNAAVPNLELKDVAEETRLIDLETRRKRGKGKQGGSHGARSERPALTLINACSHSQEGTRTPCFDEEEVDIHHRLSLEPDSSHYPPFSISPSLRSPLLPPVHYRMTTCVNTLYAPTSVAYPSTRLILACRTAAGTIPVEERVWSPPSLAVWQRRPAGSRRQWSRETPPSSHCHASRQPPRPVSSVSLATGTPYSGSMVVPTGPQRG
jgi:small subunit ribosomal protein S33